MSLNRHSVWADCYRIVPDGTNPFDGYRVLLVGEDNPQSKDPAHALWPIPSTGKTGCAGKNLQSKILGLSHEHYYALWRTNLCLPPHSWDQEMARKRMVDLTKWVHPWTTIVLLGRKVARVAELVLDLDFATWTWHPRFSQVEDDLSGELVDRVVKLVSIPHPSGLSRDWNDHGNYLRVQKLLAEVAPEVPWGELGRIPVG